MSDKPDQRIGFWSVVSIGVGGMVGGGIFAVLGLAVEIARGGTPAAFLIAGAVAMLTAHAYARLSANYPNQGGTVAFLNRAFGNGLFSGAVNVMLWLSYIVMLSLYAHAFGSYGAAALSVDHNPIWKHLLISAVLVILTLLNARGAHSVGETEEWIVGFKILLLLAFIGFGLAGLNGHRLAVGTWPQPVHLIAGGMLIFVAYEGFELIANTATDVSQPQRVLPRAYYTAVGFVIALYILIAMVTVGQLPLDEIVTARDYALAAAAKPFLGRLGYGLITLAALLSTSSAINATLYGAARVSYVTARDGELPALFERKVWRQPLEGLLITAALALVTANLMDLSSIALMGSAGFLLVFAAVNAAALRLDRQARGRRLLYGLGVAGCLGAATVLVLRADFRQLIFLAVLTVGSLLLELFYRRILHRPRPSPARGLTD
jgi:amino acid transporter